MIHTQLRVIMVAGLRYVPFLLHVVFLGVIYTSVLPTANTAKAWGSIALLILEMYHRVQTGDDTALLTYRYRFLYTIRDNLAGPIPAPHTIRFVVRSDELLNSKYGRSATGAERPILIPSTTVAQAFGSMSPENRNKPNYRCN